MARGAVELRALRREEIGQVEGFPPPEWSFAFAPFLERHLGASYFEAVVAESDERIVGVGNAIINGRVPEPRDLGAGTSTRGQNRVAWLGNIIVPPSERGRGIGSRITQRLIDLGRERGATTLLLIATDLGVPVYRKLGFETSSLYRFYRGERVEGPAPRMPRVRRLRSDDRGAVLELDARISGEDRAAFLSGFLEGGWVCEGEQSGSVDGFYLPALGAGLVVAASEESGLELLRLRVQGAPASVVAPDGNSAAQRWLLSHGYKETATAPRMHLGPEVDWRPDRIFSRGAGYCG